MRLLIGYFGKCPGGASREDVDRQSFEAPNSEGGAASDSCYDAALPDLRPSNPSWASKPSTYLALRDKRRNTTQPPSLDVMNDARIPPDCAEIGPVQACPDYMCFSPKRERRKTEPAPLLQSAIVQLSDEDLFRPFASSVAASPQLALTKCTRSTENLSARTSMQVVDSRWPVQKHAKSYEQLSLFRSTAIDANQDDEIMAMPISDQLTWPRRIASSANVQHALGPSPLQPASSTPAGGTHWQPPRVLHSSQFQPVSDKSKLPPIQNTGNTGPLVAQEGDWTCGVCHYVNWRRRTICMRCFPQFAGKDAAQRFIVAQQEAAKLAEEAKVVSEGAIVRLDDLASRLEMATLEWEPPRSIARRHSESLLSTVPPPVSGRTRSITSSDLRSWSSARKQKHA
ncbi:uncharacterized protein L969DRAFT_100740 [Mixia osmundae IAM 14324]|uniref:RanBP2-type domain-containing protein n=1 Tax=Mixia osmundae (strain CBS 9802 / IAM 14324 / JCM 22182 / KY 12970) TaxID=764103 RepID=G7E083_MIXOS|nr:uncharacterized protein L969DRAFT_100740 [Mixia osmundae IAM 14324]KEI42233.1 hypothetical protein L969DRAFT_100740 [Mixia osmundae IAM 14324]GAA96243.1 hypothetical protein E5Q_02907 [Mixia osmundae IAM 14324]